MKISKIKFINIKYRRLNNEKSNNYSIRYLFDFNKTFIYNRVLRFFVINNIKRFIIYILTFDFLIEIDFNRELNFFYIIKSLNFFYSH